ncbi:hypothetical protein [Pantoea dispersa]|uniref:hypothetical protein n=1 Tax=Pantoea dispersa TaxID=59814 RepID=UPI0039B6A756
MIKKKSLPLMLITLASLSATSASATDGTLTFKGSVNDNTCVITGHNSNVTFSEVSVAEVQSLPHFRTIETIVTPINISSCPASYSTVKIKTNFSADGGNWIVPEAGSELKGVTTRLTSPDTGLANKDLHNDDEFSINLLNNAAVFNVHSSLTRNRTLTGAGGAVNVVPGSSTGLLNLTMTFE